MVEVFTVMGGYRDGGELYVVQFAAFDEECVGKVSRL
jgi:hypothetical protein